MTREWSPLTHMPIEPAYAQRGKRGPNDQLLLIVLHDMEAPEDNNRARNVGRHWFSTPKSGKASTHYGVDNIEIVGYVPETHTCYGAGGGTNSTAIHVEHPGYARQSREEWMDEYSLRTLDRSARLFADLCRTHNIPPEFVDAEALGHPKATGITSHREITNGRTGGKGHTDPGPDFPWDWFIARVGQYHANPTRLPYLGLGDNDDNESLSSTPGIVAKAQTNLATLGHYSGDIDGDYGPMTQAAVEAYGEVFEGRRSEGACPRS